MRFAISVNKFLLSPSMRRVWIEMFDLWLEEGFVLVTLHAEGVD